MHTEQDAQWQPFFQAVRRRLSQQAFETWFRPLRLSRNSTDQVLRISTPNEVVKDWILSKYSSTLHESLAESNLASMRIEWTRASTSSDSKPAPVDRLQPEAKVSPSTATASPDFSISDDSILNDKYTFDAFVVASCNQLAHAAAQAVADSPGKTYNPLYLYGGVGLGKTHLIQATGHAIARANPSL